ncbi:hypothetical protein V5N11_029828 [Cardamine amara subsp. amara]|uniref:Reverse transcriptase zinc-binding domain-containing protein n=1 Tax=Cardamine amara subsp. amara TaxID=228776 RepID=A0ABD1AS08_CARAN
MVSELETIRLWIPTHPPSPTISVNPPPHMRMHELWQSQCNHWDESKIHSLFNDDIQHAQRMYIPHHSRADKLIWHYTKDDNYIVKLGYWLSTHVPNLDMHLNPPQGNPALKVKIWKTKLLAKLKHFYWRAVSQALGTGTELN